MLPVGEHIRSAMQRLTPMSTRCDTRSMRVRPAAAKDHDRVEAFLVANNADQTARRGELVDALRHPALIAEGDDDLAGVLTYILGGQSCEVLTLHATVSWQGVGTAPGGRAARSADHNRPVSVGKAPALHIRRSPRSAGDRVPPRDTGSVSSSEPSFTSGRASSPRKKKHVCPSHLVRHGENTAAPSARMALTSPEMR
jgi:hypothetical protein